MCFLQKIQRFSLIGNQNSEHIFRFWFLIKTDLYIYCKKQLSVEKMLYINETTQKNSENIFYENSVIFNNIMDNFRKFSYKMLNIPILFSRNSKTCNRNNFTFWVTEV